MSQTPRQLSRVLGAAAVTLVLATSACAGAQRHGLHADSDGGNGRIVYMVKDGAGHWQIWVGSSGRSRAKKLTHGRSDSGWAVWSPHGRRIAFDSNRADPTPNDSKRVNDVFVMKPDGSGVKKLTQSTGSSGDAAWSPDGSLIAFEADHGNSKGFSAIYVMHADGQKLREVTRPRSPLSDYAPRFSPDGTHLVFSRSRGTADHAPEALFTVGLDGKGLQRVTSFSLHVGDADWSPDGKRIVFEAYPTADSFGDIYVVDAAGGGVVNLTQNPVGQAGSADPVWSPDGTKILFLDNRVVGGVGRTGLATMNPDGTHRRFLSSNNVEAHQPDWEASR
jgi:Tol biopolymer transport system component